MSRPVRPSTIIYLDVQPALGAQFLLDLSDRDRLIACDEDFALVASGRDQDTEASPKNSTDEAIYEHLSHRPPPSLFPAGADVTAKLNVSAARISASVRSFTRPPRRPISKARLSRICQIAPTNPDLM